VLNSAVKADYICRDAGSGVASCPGSAPNGGNIDTGTLGSHTFTVGPATDLANHTASAVTVTYTVVRYRKVLFSSARSGGGDIYATNADGTGVATRLTTSSALDEQPSWSPDGSKIAFASARNNSKGSGLDIFVMDANGLNVKQFTFAGGDDTAPAWSADGSKIAFQSKRDGNPEIYVMNNDGTGQRRLTINTTQDAEPAWGAGANAQMITFLSNRTNAVLNVWVMDSSGANQRQLTSTAQPDGTPSFSPDGTKILFASKRGTTGGGTVFDIYTMNPSTGSILQRLTNSKNGDFEPSWSRDGTKIAFTSLRDGNPEVYTMDANGSGPMRLTTNATADNQPDW
jgi:Tol biopolymer transport system component